MCTRPVSDEPAARRIVARRILLLVARATQRLTATSHFWVVGDSVYQFVYRWLLRTSNITQSPRKTRSLATTPRGRRRVGHGCDPSCGESSLQRTWLACQLSHTPLRSCRVVVIECVHARAESEKEREKPRIGGWAQLANTVWSNSVVTLLSFSVRNVTVENCTPCPLGSSVACCHTASDTHVPRSEASCLAMHLLDPPRS